MQLLKYVFLIGIISLSVSCKTTSKLVDQNSRNYKLSEELSNSLAKVIWDDVEGFPILDNVQYGQLYRYVEKTAKRVGENAGESRPSHVFIIARDDMKHAFMLPNGVSYISTGLIKALQTDLELAAVYSWLVAHNTEPFLLDHLWQANEKKSIQDCAINFKDCESSLLEQYMYGSFTAFELNSLKNHSIDIMCYSTYDIQGLRDLAKSEKLARSDFIQQFSIATTEFEELEMCRSSFEGTNLPVAKRVLNIKPYRIMNQKNMDVSPRRTIQLNNTVKPIRIRKQ